MVDQDQILFHFSGCGAAFPYSLGYAAHLRDNFCLGNNLHYSGVSAGALVAVCLRLKVELPFAAELAYRYQQRLSTRRLGLLGVWRQILVPYYHELLPDDINYDRLDRLHIKVTYINGQSTFIDRFESKGDLINAILASQHIPFFLDLKPWVQFRGRRCLDADVLCRPIYPAIRRKLIISPYDKESDSSPKIGFLESLSRKSRERIEELQNIGYDRAQRNYQKHKSLGLLAQPAQGGRRSLALAPDCQKP
ncbi:MAG: patatin-like phospholipase family protein [Oligoflexus sp.]